MFSVPLLALGNRGGSRHSQHSQLRMSDFPSLIIPIIMLKVMNELRFKTQKISISLFIMYLRYLFLHHRCIRYILLRSAFAKHL